MSNHVKVGIIGATGYAGLELTRLLLRHPLAQLAAVSSVTFEGRALEEVYPAMAGEPALSLVREEDVVAQSDVVFASLPHGLSEDTAAACWEAGKLFIDLGADFRLENEEDYRRWYQGEYADKELHRQAVYALPELFREQIRGGRLLGNPGCYPTAIALGLAPLMRGGLVDPGSIIIDAKSGVTGAGRGLSQTTHYPDCNEGFSAYKVAEHRHTPEIEQTLSRLAGKPVTVTFVPHLLPVNRGILATIYASPRQPTSPAELFALYSQFYRGEGFVRVMKPGQAVNLKQVKYSNFCDISLHTDPRTDRVIVCAVLDNMVKGAAGQAIQNMNIALGLPEDAGLDMIPPSF